MGTRAIRYSLALLLCACILQSCDDGCKGILQSVQFEKEATKPIQQYLEANVAHTGFGGKAFCACSIYGSDSSRVYLWYHCQEYYGTADTLLEGTGSSGPIALTYRRDSNMVSIISHQKPRDGAEHASDLEAIFPPCVLERIDKENSRPDTMHASTRERAKKWITYPLPDTFIRR